VLGWIGAHKRAAVAVMLSAALCLAFLPVVWHRPRAAVTVTAHEVARTDTHAEGRAVAEVRAAVVTRAREAVDTTTTIARPDGTRIRVERRRVAEVESRAASAAVTVAEVTTDAHQTVTRDTVTVTSSAPAPRFRVAAVAEWSSTALAVVPAVRFEGEYRVKGPLWLRASVAPPVLGQRLDVRAAVVLAFEW